MAGHDSFHVAIVGGGACGLAALIQLVERGSSGLRIIILEKNSAIGPGLAYSDACVGTRVNMHANSMSLFPNDATHFSRWLKKNPSHSDVEAGGDEFPPREHFGAYLKDTVAATIRYATEKGIYLATRNVEVVDMEQTSDGWVIHSADKSTVRTTDVILAMGNTMSQIYKHLIDRPLYFPNPWPNSRLTKEIPKTASIAILGSRLTAIDEALYLTDRGYTGKIYLLSRSGQLPKVQAVQKLRPSRVFAVHNLARELEENPRGAIITIVRRIHEEMSTDKTNKGSWVTSLPSFEAPSDTLSSFRQDVENAREGNVPGQAILRETAPVIERYWRCLDDCSKQTFMKEYMSIWTTYRHAMPLRTGQRLLRLIEKGQLRVLKINTKKKVRFTDPGFKIPVIAPVETSIDVAALIEATGIEYNASRIETPLMRNLLSRQILTPCSSGGVECDFQTLRANKGLYILGSMTRGVHFYSTAIDRNVPHAERVVDDILEVQQRKPLHVGLFVGSDIYSTLIVSQLIPKLIIAGHVPFLYPMASNNSGVDLPSEIQEHNFFERTLLQSTIAPLLGKEVSKTGHCLTLQQLTARHGLLNHPVSNSAVSDPDFIRSLQGNHIDLGFSITSGTPLRFPRAILAHFQSRLGIFNLQSGALPSYRGLMTAIRAMANGEADFGYSLHQIVSERESGLVEGPVVDVQLQPLDANSAMLNYLGTTWQIATEMLFKHTERCARGETIPALAFPLTGVGTQTASWGIPTRDDLSVYRAQGLSLVDPAGMKELLVQAFAAEGQETILREAIESACGRWYMQRSRTVPAQIALDVVEKVASRVEARPAVSVRSTSSEEENAKVHEILAKDVKVKRVRWGLTRKLNDRLQSWGLKRGTMQDVSFVSSKTS